jgi:hypothetical protein
VAAAVPDGQHADQPRVVDGELATDLTLGVEPAIRGSLERRCGPSTVVVGRGWLLVRQQGGFLLARA